jgi:SAM-dependent methyltransferase
LSAAGRSHAERAIADLGRGDRGLDVGGGPGSHAGVWAKHGIEAYVLDPGAAMATAAGQQRGVVSIRSRSQTMPLRDDAMHLVYFHLSIHYGNWRAALDEAQRVLAPGGVLWIWTLGPDHHASSFLQRWFPRVEDLDRARFPDPDALAAHLRSWASVDVGHEEEPKARPAGEWSAAVRAGFVSTLQLLTPDETEAGLAAFAAAFPDPAVEVEYQLRWTWLTAHG